MLLLIYSKHTSWLHHHIFSINVSEKLIFDKHSLSSPYHLKTKKLCVCVCALWTWNLLKTLDAVLKNNFQCIKGKGVSSEKLNRFKEDSLEIFLFILLVYVGLELCCIFLYSIQTCKNTNFCNFLANSSWIIILYTMLFYNFCSLFAKNLHFAMHCLFYDICLQSLIPIFFFSKYSNRCAKLQYTLIIYMKNKCSSYDVCLQNLQPFNIDEKIYSTQGNDTLVPSKISPLDILYLS